MAGEQLRTLLRHLRRVVTPDGSDGLSDAQLLERFVTRGDEAAFEVLVWRHGGLVLGVCGRLLRQTQDAEDVFQATFLALARRAGSIGKREALGSWLYKVAYRVALRVRCRAAREATHERCGLDLPAPRTTACAVDADLRAVLDEEIDRLPEKYRVPVVLCYLEGKTTEEAGRLLGCPRGTICSRLSWARQRLGSRLSRRGVTLTATGVLAALAPSAAPAALIGPTVRAAVSFATNRAADGALSAPAALAKGVLQAMLLTRLTKAVAAIFVLSVLGVGTGLGGLRVVAQRPGAPEAPVLIRGADSVRLPAELTVKTGIQTAEARARPARGRVLQWPGSLALDPERLSRVRCRFAPAEVLEVGKPGSDAAMGDAVSQELLREVLRGPTEEKPELGYYPPARALVLKAALQRVVVKPDAEQRELRTGDRVRKGQVLAVLSSLDVAAKKQDLFDALVQLKLDQEILRRAESNREAIPEVFLLQAKRTVQADLNAITRAERTLLAWGIPENDIEAVRKEANEEGKPGAGGLDPKSAAARKERLKRWSRVEIRAPQDGTIIERNVTRSEIITDVTVNLFTIARLDRLRVVVHVAEGDLPVLNALEPKQRRWTIRTPSDPEAPPLEGWIDHVGYLIDPKQHTVVVTGLIDNPRGRARAGQYITASLTLPPAVGEVVLPASALVEDGRHSFVFVQPDPKRFVYEQRRVSVVRRGQDVVHIRSQLTPEQEREGVRTVRPGERVVTGGVVEVQALLEDLKAAAGK
jgi:cobalt-zinc-cadmium efflux system membrane fusion protein